MYDIRRLLAILATAYPITGQESAVAGVISLNELSGVLSVLAGPGIAVTESSPHITIGLASPLFTVASGEDGPQLGINQPSPYSDPLSVVCDVRGNNDGVNLDTTSSDTTLWNDNAILALTNFDGTDGNYCLIGGKQAKGGGGYTSQIAFVNVNHASRYGDIAIGVQGASFSEVMRLSHLKRVGILTTAPDYALDIVGQVNSSVGYSVGGVMLANQPIATLAGYPGLTNWYDASQTTGVTNGQSFPAGGVITDRAGSVNLVRSTSGSGSRYNVPGQGGKTTVSVLSDYLQSAATALNSGPLTIMVCYNVLSNIGIGGYGSLVAYGSATNAANDFLSVLLLGNTPSYNPHSVVNAGTFTDVTGLGSGNTTSGFSQCQISCMRFDGKANTDYRLNGIQGAGALLPTTIATPGTIWVGNNYYSQQVDLEFCELAVFDRVLSTIECCSVEQYLKGKWGAN